MRRVRGEMGFNFSFVHLNLLCSVFVYLEDLLIAVLDREREIAARYEA